MSSVVSGSAQVNAAQAMRLLGMLYKPLEALAQAVENERDAKIRRSTTPQRLWVELFPDRFVITGEGHGLLPMMLSAEKPKIEQALAKGTKLKADREDFTTPSLLSFEFIMEHIATITLREADERGLRRIGILAWLVYGTEAKIISKPHPDLAEKLWGRRTSIPTHVLHLPTDAQLLAGSTDYQVTLAETPEEQLLSPTGNELPHGTKLVVSGLREGTHENFTPGLIAEYFRIRFAKDIRSRNLRVVIIDRRKKKSGVETRLEPPKYLGIALFGDKGRDITIVPASETQEGAIPAVVAHIDLYLNKSGKNLSPYVMRQGGGNLRLADIPHFTNRFPWASGRIDGEIDMPFPGSEHWDTAKGGLALTAEVKLWIATVEALEPEVIQRIEEEDAKTRGAQSARKAADLTTALNRALGEVGAFKDAVVSRPERPQSTRTEKEVEEPSSKSRSPSPASITVYVRDEHDQPVSHVVVQLFPENSPPQQLETGVSGQVGFKRLKAGMYIVQLEVPEDCTADSPTQEYRSIPQLEPRPVVFRIKTGQPRRIKRRLERSVKAEIVGLEDPEQIYDLSKLHLGLLAVNGDSTVIQGWVEEDDYDDVVAQCMAAGFTDYLLDGPKDFLFHSLIKLSVALKKHLAMIREQREQEEKTAARRRQR